MVLGVGGAQATGVDQVLDERVVRGHLFELVVAQQVGARVSDVRHGDGVTGTQQRRHGGAESAERRVVAGALHDLGVGAGDGFLQRLSVSSWPQRLGVESRERSDRDGRGDVAARGAAHAVGDDQEVGSGEAES